MGATGARALCEALRPHQWVKNVFVFAPLAFCGDCADPQKWIASLAAFCCFCLAASGMYLVNDLCDRRSDQVHPLKRHRPVASGRLPTTYAAAASLGLLLLSLVGAYGVNPMVAAIILAYVAVVTSYSLVLKHMMAIDVLAIAFCFVLRVAGGSAASNSPPSGEMILCITLVVCLLGFSKRRTEMALIRAPGRDTRRVLNRYTPAFLDIATGLSAVMTILCYVWCLGAHGSVMLWTTPLVACGVMRYVYLVYRHAEGEDPARTISRDVPLVFTTVVWLVLTIALSQGLVR